MILTKEVNKENFYSTYYRALNGILNLTNKEIDVLSELSTRLNEDEVILNSTRSKSIENLGITNHNFNNLFKKLKDKGFIIENNKGTTINPYLFKRIDSDTEVTFKFKLHDNSDK